MHVVISPQLRIDYFGVRTDFYHGWGSVNCHWIHATLLHSLQGRFANRKA